MSSCKTCGDLLEASGGGGICPACAILHVLQGEWDYLPSPSDLPVKEPSPLINRLPYRENFFGKYLILEAIDDGGQGQVWKVWDYEFRRQLAMKGLSEKWVASVSACYRFLAEAQITSQLRHPGILPVYDAGLDFEGRPFYTTELSTGIRLDKKLADLKQGQWTKPALNSTLEIIARVCEIMAHVHSRGVIHRDLKPANILVGEFGDVRVIDWGSAAILKVGSDSIEEPFVQMNAEIIQTDRDEMLTKRPDLATGANGWPSTPIFTAPELLGGDVRELGPETDIYSIGVILYEILTDQLPFIGRDRTLLPAEIRRQVLENEPVRVRRVNPRQSRDFDAITMRAMARDPLCRYHSMQELAADIRAAIELRPVQARTPGFLLRTKRHLQRHPSQTFLVGLLLLVTVIGFFSVRDLRTQQKVTRQVQALESAELARRNGHWRESLQHLDEAEAAGYSDRVSLGLKRAEVWTVLNEPDRSKVELGKLDHVAHQYQGLVLLRKGEHALYDAQDSDQGVELVKKALESGLDPADEAFARGLLAPTTPEALQLFQQALALNPYHHGAHTHLLGLAFLLGLHQELAAEIHIYKTLYPDDLFPNYIEAFECALDGRLGDAQTALSRVQQQTSRDTYRQLQSECRLTAELAEFLDIEKSPDLIKTNPVQTLTQILPVSSPGLLKAPTDPIYPARMPHLSCVARGLIEAYTGVKMLGIGLLSQPDVAVQKIKSAHQIHPEGTPALLGGILLGKMNSVRGIDRRHLWALQGEMFELAANSSSKFPKAPRLARYLAARSQFNLATNPGPGSKAAAQLCLSNIWQACAGTQNSITTPASRLPSTVDARISVRIVTAFWSTAV